MGMPYMYLPVRYINCSTVSDHPIIHGHPSLFNLTGEIYKKSAEAMCQESVLVSHLVLFVTYTKAVPVK